MYLQVVRKPMIAAISDIDAISGIELLIIIAIDAGEPV